MGESECGARTVKAYIMSDLLKKVDYETRNEFVKIAVAVAGFYMGIFYRMYKLYGVFKKNILLYLYYCIIGFKKRWLRSVYNLYLLNMIINAYKIGS